MSRLTNKTAVNVYSLLDNELDRMHDLLRMYLAQAPREDGYYNNTFGQQPPRGISSRHADHIYSRILEIQDSLRRSVETTDAHLQEKIAEFALTGSTKDED